ncbi:MAG TPA: hypothetical protein V6D14_05765 [Coleofasciculaceae cyanobacterium]
MLFSLLTQKNQGVSLSAHNNLVLAACLQQALQLLVLVGNAILVARMAVVSSFSLRYGDKGGTSQIPMLRLFIPTLIQITEYSKN